MSVPIDPNSSPLLKRISQAISQHQQSGIRLRISVAKETKWEKSTSDSDEVLVRWLCWNLEDMDDQEITEPEFEVVAQEITSDRLTKEVPGFFPGVQVVVDNDIEV